MISHDAIQRSLSPRFSLAPRGRKLRQALVLATTALVTACSSSSPTTESTGSASAAITQTEAGVFTAADLTEAVNATNIWGSSFPFSAGALEFIPSACGIDDIATIPTGIVTLPTTVVSSGISICPQYTASFTSFSVPSFLGTLPFGDTDAGASSCASTGPGPAGTLALTTSGLQATLALTGTLHLAAGVNGGYSACPSGDVEITGGTIAITLAWQAATEAFKASVVSNLQYNVANCWGGACNSMLASGVGNLNGQLGTTLASALNTAFANSTTAARVTSALYGALATDWNLKNGSISDPWSVVPGTVQYVTTAGGEFTFNVTRTAPPAAPGCVPVATCSSEYIPPGSSAGATGTYSIDTVTVTSNTCKNPATSIEQFVNGVWVPLADFSSNPSNPVENTGIYDIQGAVGSAQSVKACSTDSGGTSCDPPSSVTVANCCVPLTCGADFCGTLADGCGGTLECGTCAAGLHCAANQCSKCAITSCPAGESLVECACVKVEICICGGTYPACEACK
jgi:hypothetical protein